MHVMVSLTENEIVELLKNSDVFSAVPDEDLRSLAAGFASRTFAAGEVAVQEGERGGEIFIVVDGEFEVFSAEKNLATLGKGELFGEMAALTGGKRYASVVAKTDADVIVNGETSFHEVLRSSRELSEAILKSLDRYA